MKIEKLAITSPDVSNGIVPCIVSGALNAVTTTAACGVTNYFTTLNTTGGAIVPTLANGALTGQLRKIQMTVKGGANTAVLTPATAFQGGATTITFSAVGETAELIWNGAAWQVLALYSVLDGAAAPVLA